MAEVSESDAEKTEKQQKTAKKPRKKLEKGEKEQILKQVDELVEKSKNKKTEGN